MADIYDIKFVNSVGEETHLTEEEGEVAVKGLTIRRCGRNYDEDCYRIGNAYELKVLIDD